MAKSFTLYKLIILYMLNKVDFPLTNSQISEFILDEGYTTYFKLQQAQTIHFFKNDISPAIQEDIDTFLKEKQYELKNEVAVKSDYYRNSNMEYSVRCQVIEHDTPLIDLTLSVPTQAEAETIANNWAKKNQEVYALIMSNLL